MVKAKSQSGLDSTRGAEDSRSNGSVLLLAALDMSWRLAIVVLVPIVGGYELDKHLGITPALTVLGFLIAMAGVFLVMKSTLANADNKANARRSH